MDSLHLSHPLNSVPYSQQWELIRPSIEQLYIHEGKKLAEVIDMIHTRHGFSAHEPQYKYQIKKWGLKKSTSVPKKEAICRVVKHRAREGKKSIIKRGTKDFDVINFYRYLKTESRRTISLHPAAIRMSGDTCWPTMNIMNFGNRIFMNWNMPHGVLGPSAVGAADHLSPISDIEVTTPVSNDNPPSPMAMTIAEITAIDRAQLFVDGKHDELLQSMGQQQRALMSTWMYQFWLFGLKTAKHWGKGPRDWTADLLGFEDYYHRSTITYSSPTTPQTTDTPTSQPSLRSDEDLDPGASNPPSLCRWSIHHEIEEYEGIPSPSGSSPYNTTTEDERRWPDGYESNNFTQKLCDNIESNQFSSIEPNYLPIETKRIANAARRSGEELFKESLGFCIMGRNEDLLKDLLERVRDESINIDDVRPFHLAASYLDGSLKCCNILEILVKHLSAFIFNFNDLGHTVLDQLMVTILKSHSSCLPNVVDDAFNKSKRFEGDDVDICGRWDADSDCMRQRFTSGLPHIPFRWKHMFCHTSVQAICHSIGILFKSGLSSRSQTSGLFLRRCVHCGLKLQLLPLHTLMMIAYHLSVSGCDGETLFGIVACLVCLLSYGWDSSLRANMSIDLLMGVDEDDDCNHQEVDPCELGEQIIAKSYHSWSKDVAIGWGVIIQILKRSTKKLRTQASDHGYSIGEQQEDDDFEALFDQELDADINIFQMCSWNECHSSYFGRSRILAPLWAAIQTEFLTYRRQKEGDPWISEHFDMAALLEGLTKSDVVAIPLVQNEMMKPFCDGGNFHGAHLVRVTSQNAAAYYFSNLEDWNRSTFLPLKPDEFF